MSELISVFGFLSGIIVGLYLTRKKQKQKELGIVVKEEETHYIANSYYQSVYTQLNIVIIR